MLIKCESIYQCQVGQGGMCLDPLTKCLKFESWEWKKFLLGDSHPLQGPPSCRARLVKFLVIGLGFEFSKVSMFVK